MLKQSEIYSILDLAREIRRNGEVFNPLFSSPPGLGKSVIVQTWCKENKLPFIDLRAAYLESPDLIGFPLVTKDGERQVTDHMTPSFWPIEGEGVILLDEPNRGNTSVLNTFMQILTDRKVHKYTLPPGWIIVACINPEDEYNDVNSMDTALKDRFEIFHVEFDKAGFVDYIRDAEWHEDIIAFVETGTWKYVKPQDIKVDGGKYISPRTLSKLNSVLKTGYLESLEMALYESILGKAYAVSFYNLRHKQRPVLYRELADSKTRKEAISRLKSFAAPEDYKAGMISFTVRDIIDSGKIDDSLLKEIILSIPADQGPVLLKELSFRNKDESLLKRITSEYPEVKKYLQDALV